MSIHTFRRTMVSVAVAGFLFAVGASLPVDYSAPADVADDVVSSCALDVLAGLDEAAEGDNGYPVPSLGWNDAVAACEGAASDVLIYEDGSVAVLDTDYEYPPFVFCMAGEALCRD
jgi:hypothetical protein